MPKETHIQGVRIRLGGSVEGASQCQPWQMVPYCLVMLCFVTWRTGTSLVQHVAERCQDNRKGTGDSPHPLVLHTKPLCLPGAHVAGSKSNRQCPMNGDLVSDESLFLAPERGTVLSTGRGLR